MKVKDRGPVGPDEKWSKQIDRVVIWTAARISADLDRMVRDLPEGAAPQMAVELMIDELTQLQPWFLEKLDNGGPQLQGNACGCGCEEAG